MYQFRFVPASLCPIPPHYVPVPFRTNLTMYQVRRVPDSTDHSTINFVQERRGRSFNFNAGLIWKGNIGKISGVLCLIIIGEFIKVLVDF